MTIHPAHQPRRLKTQLESMNVELTAAKAELEKASSGLSQSAMLDLELADYKRSVDQLSL